MKIWSFQNPSERKFAYATTTGACWDEKRKVRRQPLIVEWEPGSTVIGDFNVDFWGVFVKREVADELIRLGVRGFEPGPVEVRENSERRKRKAKNRVTFPYEGPPLAELWVTKWVRMDPERTTYEFETLSDGTARKVLVGTERKETDWNRETFESTDRWIPREPGKGLYVKASELGGCQLLAVYEFSVGRPVCTDEFKKLVESKGYTNVAFREIGEVI
jgi:hypothetical protein